MAEIPFQTQFRSHTCGQLTLEQVDQTVTLCGWVDSARDFGGAVFVDLRDRFGKTQVVFAPEAGKEIVDRASELRNEDVIRVVGKVTARPEGTRIRDHYDQKKQLNGSYEEDPAKFTSGDIEVRCTTLELLNKGNNPPFIPTQDDLPGEETRLKYRFIDLRRWEMQQTLLLRHRMTHAMRQYFDRQGFIDVETPVLGRSTPEGARDYLVPSRVHPGEFYALPQSPQLYKQILMIAGYDRYVQVARCFRDEDLRADRQPEFTQIDVEMSFVGADDVMGIVDGLVAEVSQQVLGQEVSLPLPRMTYDEAMERFGHDAPDLRFGLELVDVTDLAKEAEFMVFKSAADGGKRVRGLNATGAADKYSRKAIDELTEYVKQDFGAKGLVWFKVDADGKLQSPVAKKFADSLLEEIRDRLEGKPGDFLAFVADDFEITCKALNGLRKRFGRDLKLYGPGQMHYSWVVEFPMFAKDEETGGWAAMHHPFTAPRPQDVELLKTDPGACRAQAYDLVINGSEAAGGTIRIHDPGVQQQVFNLLGLDEETARNRFGFLLDALKFGAPPHGGIALGLDRWVMLFAGLENIRDVIAFPKTQRATDLMTGAPSEVDLKQLRELSIQVKKP